jgi:hypothetical protein
MKITTFRTWQIVNAENGKKEDYLLPAGTYEVEEIPCPLGYDCNWYVLKGTLIGAAVGALTQWKDCPEGDTFRIVFSDN